MTESAVEVLASAFAKEPDLDQARVTPRDSLWLGAAQGGLGFLVNHSGKLYTRSRCTLKDVGANSQARGSGWSVLQSSDNVLRCTLQPQWREKT